MICSSPFSLRTIRARCAVSYSNQPDPSRTQLSLHVPHGHAYDTSKPDQLANRDINQQLRSLPTKMIPPLLGRELCPFLAGDPVPERRLLPLELACFVLGVDPIQDILLAVRLRLLVRINGFDSVGPFSNSLLCDLTAIMLDDVVKGCRPRVLSCLVN